ncbi:MAG: EamA-like protein transporter family protein [Candidatus Falkowbacteria bacterium GW2011_GWC2_38_22]|uniref:EamA-like protein transporter family protein n=1 Tax=Candidatus Falkowbacteria bacterium GW2011_GWE1_38_31 TaxID=1618638 RepID=A0A0G0JRN8_9BACT|nr:MAG: EamA-like protein transporter family protein [Candidatus Falkowbacteria bacterium GW2011_GWF2_38_1205]KKQ61032.1 MAG: EamA-like protein transporter family protein [Candidatus Falkowbacteria bacterium GW2011_GWC2_38_22]KKQ63439.1 MAG: EamA-like protein transporter family protein [Candidatus Falkowbacteria bacterium GW2011_GWF1_38_22]KKQ65490.1 MAG: EamA-like protein transporter family protein [Candidatus Falkowbacteria bacterium GW2011_GWE2_38_254]KKQ70203.1 MAG: EamA-like protein transp
MFILIAILSYSINAGIYVADKFLLSKKIHSSITYAFFVGIWSIFNFVLLFIDPWLPNLQELGIDLFAGFLFLGTLVFWYKALHQSEATRVVPIVGALVPIFSFIFSFIFFGETLSERQLLAFVILIMGGVLISVKHTRFYRMKEVGERVRGVFGDVLGPLHARYRPTQRLIINSIVSALFFAAYYVMIKYVYSTQPFIGAFVWSRLGSFLGVLMILFVPEWRAQIVKHQKGQKSPKNMGFFISVRLLAAIAFIMLNWAISMGNVALINSLQGTQYVFLILLVIFLSTKFPDILEEELGGDVVLQKVMGTVMIGIGLYMLVV